MDPFTSFGGRYMNVASLFKKNQENPLPQCPSELTPKEEQLKKSHQYLQDLQGEIKYYDQGPYLLGMNSDGAYSFYFPNSVHLEDQLKSDDPVFDPTKPQLPLQRYSFAEYFRSKAQKELEQEERKAIEEEEKAAWERLNDLKKDRVGKTSVDFSGVPKNYKITMQSLGMTGTRLVVQDFNYMPPNPDDAPNVQRIAVTSVRTIDHPNLKYRPFSDGSY